MRLRGWRSARVVLPVPLLMVSALVVLANRADALCEEQTAISAMAPDRYRYGSHRAALIGDSWAVGDGAHSAFPAHIAKALKLDLDVSAVGGTGYLNGGACGGESFVTRVSYVPPDARMVILAGGLNDTGEDAAALNSAAATLVLKVHRQAPGAMVVVLGVPAVPLLDDDRTDRADAVLQAIDSDEFINVREVDVAVLADDIHPTPDGHVQYAHLIVDALQGSALE